MTTAETTAPAEHKHAFPCNPPGGTFLNPGPCECGKTYAQDIADREFQTAIGMMAIAYGQLFRVSTEWCIAWGGEDANDCAGRLEYDDEAGAREMTQWIDGGIVARQTVIRLPWVNAPDKDEETTP